MTGMKTRTVYRKLNTNTIHTDVKGKGNPGTIPGLYDLFTHYNIIPPFRLSNTH